MVLKDHVKRKRRLIPPFLDKMGEKLSFYSWERELAPDFVWLAFLNEAHGIQGGFELASCIADLANKTHASSIKPHFSRLSAFSLLSEKERDEVLGQLDSHCLTSLRSTLSPLAAVWPTFPLKFLGFPDNLDVSSAIQIVKPTLGRLYDRNSREATLSIATAVLLESDQGRLVIDTKLGKRFKDAIRDVAIYPETELSRSAGSLFRAMAPMLFKSGDAVQDNTSWSAEFWKEAFCVEECVGEGQTVPELPATTGGFEEFVGVYKHLAHKDFRVRQQSWPISIENLDAQPVILALLARQASLAIDLVSNPGTWNANIAPILLRASADVHITLEWLLGDPVGRVHSYVQSGLGDIKLEIAHREAALESDPDGVDEAQLSYIEGLKQWLSYQKFAPLVEVNLGSWSGKSTRAMAEEAGCLDFYNYVFQPFSSAVHSSWAHIGRFNVTACDASIHPKHFLPVIRTFEADPHWCWLAAKYYRKSLKLVDDFLKLDDMRYESYEVAEDAVIQMEAGAAESKNS
ncbi:DUF5677 domain-containing protein [Aestuariivirga sp.]|uniref:DUF5677 domain-containing protein n=1 Tax=Aestuariivirga sp. TaxID=2650926 RepID=UPI0035B2C775